MAATKKLIDRYAQNRVIRALIQLTPWGVGSALDALLMDTVVRMREERSRVFFDELARGNVLVNEDLLKDNDFIHAFFSTTTYALNSRRKEKIQMFAQLLKSSQLSGGPADFDEYEDFLKVLEELSFRELRALALFDSFSNRSRQHDHNDLQWVNTFWDEFERVALSELGIPSEEVADFMNRVARTGCYEMFTGGYMDYTGGRGRLTPTYQKLKSYIQKGDSGAS